MPKWSDKHVIKSRRKDDQTHNYVYLKNLRPILITHSRGDSREIMVAVTIHTHTEEKVVLQCTGNTRGETES